jgi:hypothetical protein
MIEPSPGLRRATDRQILLPRSAKAGPLALPPAVPQLAELEIAAATATATPRNATISCIIPCYNEQDTIADVLKSILAQTRLPDVIHVIINTSWVGRSTRGASRAWRSNRRSSRWAGRCCTSPPSPRPSSCCGSWCDGTAASASEAFQLARPIVRDRPGKPLPRAPALAGSA